MMSVEPDQGVNYEKQQDHARIWLRNRIAVIGHDMEANSSARSKFQIIDDESEPGVIKFKVTYQDTRPKFKLLALDRNLKAALPDDYQAGTLVEADGAVTLELRFKPHGPTVNQDETPAQ